MKKNKASLWIALIIFIAIFLRLYDLKAAPPGLWSDEAMNGVNTIQALEGSDWKVYYPENFGREGLFINIQAIFVKFLGHEPWVLRLPSAIFGILTVLGLYLMTRELFRLSANSESSSNKRIALFTSFFLATSFWHIIFSRMGFRAIMAPLLLVLAFYFLFRGMRISLPDSAFLTHKNPKSQALNPKQYPNPNDQNRKRFGILNFGNWNLFGISDLGFRISATLLFSLGGLLLGLGFHTYIAFRIAPLIALYPLWIFYKQYREEKLKDGICAPCLIVLFIFMALVAASPLLIYYAQNPADFFGRTSSISIFSSPQPLGQFSENVLKTAQMFNFFGDFNWRHNYAGSSQLWWPVGILFLIGIWRALRSSTPGVKSQKTPGVFPRSASNFILLWFSVMMLPVIMSSEGLPHALRAIVLIPPAMIFAALGLEFLIGRINMKFEEWEIDFPEHKKQIHRIHKELKIVLFVFFIAAASNVFNQYFFRWAPNPEVYDSFLGNETKMAHWLNNEPSSIKKYVVTNSADAVDLTGRPLSFAPIIFITDTYFENKQKEKNIYYFGSAEFDKIDCSAPCTIIPVESRPTIYETLKEKIPNLRIDGSPGFVVLKN
ncbi:hypothetical protein A3E06_03990 [Candidatus Giovannonibacteria bacterium RIFCSPHIGHO2_12_FULL_44_42]|nr:MAG: hypothetical protein A3E06_03990 [Candidatus Giovannonibacteria bacterium RIFCSPHIGHO2_12_FULL_44_42]